MEYAMPLVDDLLTELGHYLWFCSLDATSGFWAVMMTLRARKISAFVCALGHFEWFRMPFGLKNAPMIYQRMIDNALWGFVQPKGGWKRYAGRMHEAELQSLAKRRETDGASLEATTNGAAIRTKFTANHEASQAMDPLQELVNSPDAEMFSTGEPDESSLVPVLERRSFVDDICFGGETFDSCLAMLNQLLARFEGCRISVSFTKSLFIKSKVDFLPHEVSRVGIRADPKTMQTIAALPFPASKKGMQSFLGALNYYGRFILDFAVYGAALYQLKDGDFDISTAAGRFTSCSRKCAGAKCYTTPGTRVDASPCVVPGPRAEGRGDGLSPCGERGSRLAVDAEGVLLDARWQEYQSVHAVFYPGVTDQVEDTVRASCPVRCHAIAMASGDREGARKGRQVCSTSTVDGDKLR
ncbi:hypothetical protein PI125_g24515 [Phytophthora idaei]|nr:hypothetical protein PI125_g24515 [Phytophthora idaei]KAG3127566.1 hypothetical protein PI126_g21797 [Phytophthora idaei]